ncbi:hypothetical protein [Aromatoleum aromaticum]|uniref:hypothetical protein n=1 Tax=Aromatoleum aromaticum TaxID=551760 RepID=UPI000674E4FD|nr:hypothetical protein [Aromatoleum aromaticum]
MTSSVVAIAAAAAIALIVAPVAPAALREGSSYDGAVQPEGTSQRWRTDAAVRQAMDGLHAAIDANVTQGADGGIAEERLADLGGTLAARTTQLIACCTTPDVSGRHLHMILVEIADGAELMRKGRPVAAQRLGLLRVVQALNLYGDLFDHPGWQRLDEPREVSPR